MANAGDSGGATTILVTGAAGFIGRHAVSRLRTNPERVVLAATRDGRDGTRRLDLTDPGTLVSGLAGVSAIVHCAVGNRAVTVDGTRALLAAAAAVGVRRFVHLSSVAVYGDAAGIVTETTPTIPQAGEHYAAWKAAAEQACVRQTGIEIIRLRPAIVYGSGSHLWVAHLAKRIQSGNWGTFGEAGCGTCNLIHVRDVVEGIALAITRPDIAGAAFNLSGPEAITWNTWFTRMAKALGAAPLRAIPPLELMARVYGSLPLKALTRLRPGLGAQWLLGAPARSEAELFERRVTYSTEAAATALGWSPRVGLEEGLAECIAWLRAEGVVACT